VKPVIGGIYLVIDEWRGTSVVTKAQFQEKQGDTLVFRKEEGGQLLYNPKILKRVR